MLTLRDYYAFGSGGSTPSGWPRGPGRGILPPDPVPEPDNPPDPHWARASCWTDRGDYLKDTPFVPPSQPDRRWHRGNFCGVRVPGYTSGSCYDHSLLFTWELTDNTDEQMRIAVDYYADVCNYTHIVLSRPQVENQGRTLDDLLRVARYCKSKGLFVIIVAVSDGRPFAEAIPWLQACVDAGCVDIVPFCWQVDKWYDPQGCVQGIIDTGAWCHPRGLLTAIHWGGGYDGWSQSFAMWDDITAAKWGIDDRRSFNYVLAPYLDCQYGQTNTEANIDQVQSWLIKGYTFAPDSIMFVAAEEDAQPEYWWPYDRLEVYGDQKGLFCTFASQTGRVSYLNGARRRNGKVW